MRSPSTFDDVLCEIRAKSKTTYELGYRFEKLTRDFLRVDAVYANRFEKVWLWKQWPDKDGADVGVDLVAKQHDGALCAIQCKCYADDGRLDMNSVARFLAKADSLKIKHKILVYTGDDMTRNTEKILRDSGAGIITQEHFRQSSIDWRGFPDNISRIKNPHKLKPHQKIAADDVIDGFKKHDRGKMIMACGTGKTLTALHVAERQVGVGGTVLYLVPSISLILQSMREWSENANVRHRYMAVCSDKSTGEDGTITELESPASTNPDDLEKYVVNKPDSMTVIFSTYHSVEVVEKAVKGRKLDLVLCDEAHRTAGTEGKSYYTRVHDDDKLPAKKRLYMTATPKVYSDAIKSLGKQKDKIIYSMDDPDKYGPELHRLSFSDAVHKYHILADFKVKIAIVDADNVDAKFQQSVANKDRSMPLDERTLLAAVWHGIRHPDDDESKSKMLQRVIAFCNRIDRSEMFAGVIKDPDDNDRSFEGVVEEINQKNRTANSVVVRHIDGKDNALRRRNEMRWLGESTKDPTTCRILSNARCLSEGVDVPALDGVVFLNPRKSVVDVVQSVGRVMRRVSGKNYGYVILPVAIPAGIEYDQAMNDNKTFKVVWEVLNALRSHDEEFAREINKLILDRNSKDTSQVTPRISTTIIDGKDSGELRSDLFDKIKSKIIEKVGDINYYDKYGKDLGKATHTIEARIRSKMEREDTVKGEVQRFHKELLSRAFEDVISKIGLQEELTELHGFYADVAKEVSQIKTKEARQEFIKKIYGNFFESADKRGVEKHGIVYTPVEVIDFIINSVQYVLKAEFNTEFNDRHVKVLEPFTGTGTFLVRLLESGYITSNLYKKYKHDLYANELILLAYYVATVNIETTYSSLRGRYVPFDGISYTDTLGNNPRYRQGKEHRMEDTTLDGILKVPYERIRHQRGSHLHVIMGNPPYSAGQSSFDDQNQNIPYPEIDKRITDTYAKRTAVHAKNSLFDSYVRSIRWATDRIGNSGVIAFVTNASFIRSDTAAGIRASLHEEFTSIWCLDLRGNQRTQGKVSEKEGGKIFGSGSRAPVAITIFVKNPNKQITPLTPSRQKAQLPKTYKRHNIHYKNIGDYLTRSQKLEIIDNLKSIQNVRDWEIVAPDRHNDWVDQRNEEFYRYPIIGNRETKSGKESNAIFRTYSIGTATSRDAWVYNSSKRMLSNNMKRHIDYCSKQNPNRPKLDSRQAKWSPGLSDRLKNNRLEFDPKKIRSSLYRPFFKQHLYFDDVFIHRQAQIPKIFPNNKSENLVICVPYKFTGDFSALITDTIPDLHIIAANQCFPLYFYENGSKKENITEQTLSKYQIYYNDTEITKNNIFDYIYGLLHHPDYRTKFANNLIRELPRIPMAPSFEAFCNAGKALADLHLHFETCARHDLGKPKFSPSQFSKLSFGRKTSGENDGRLHIPDHTTIRADGIILFENIPETTYCVNGRTPLEWIVDRYKVTTDKDSGLTNDPCTGTDIVALIERAVHIGLESERIINTLPKEFEPGPEWEPHSEQHGILQSRLHA